jgi:leucyl/phenylalanyl-tRNA--protein transferase
MFSKVSNASKVAFICKPLKKENYKLLDCQVYNPHLESLVVEKLTESILWKY